MKLIRSVGMERHRSLTLSLRQPLHRGGARMRPTPGSTLRGDSSVRGGLACHPRRRWPSKLQSDPQVSKYIISAGSLYASRMHLAAYPEAKTTRGVVGGRDTHALRDLGEWADWAGTPFGPLAPANFGVLTEEGRAGRWPPQRLWPHHPWTRRETLVGR